MPQGSNPIKIKEWSDRLQRFAASDQTVSQFCAAEGISQPSFYHWKKRISQSNGDAPTQANERRKRGPTRASSSTFQPVQIAAAISSPQNATIRLPGGIEIELGDDLRVVESVIKLVLDRQPSHEGTPAC